MDTQKSKSKFKVGDRVIRHSAIHHNGEIGTVVEVRFDDYLVRHDSDGICYCWSNTKTRLLTPLDGVMK
jgi:hypothetical protein